MRIEPPLEKVSGTPSFPLWSFVVLFLICCGIGYYFFSPAAPAPDFSMAETTDTKVYREEQNLWVTLKKGDIVRPGENIQSWPKGGAQLSSEFVEIELKENTSLKIKKPGIFDREHSLVIILEGGYLSVKAKGQKVKVVIPAPPKSLRAKNGLKNIFPSLDARFENAAIFLTAFPDHSRYEFSVQEGSVRLPGGLPWKQRELAKGQKIEWQAEKPAAPENSVEENPAPEAPGAAAPSPVSGRLTYDLSKGVSFSTKSGRAEPVLGMEPGSGDAFIELSYDVTQPSSLAGINFPAEEIEISKFRSLGILFQRVDGRGFPEAFRIEFKSGDRIIRVFTGALKPEEDWQAFSFPLRFADSARVSEISLLLSNGKAGISKEGSLRLKNLSLGS